ncbi:hypothetical protein [Specibacter sp. NPDC078692]|uniref:hypothetical protein n=1 Tax=Specibacter sp. NPDC078692 TaxID=3155818 RepID=UPI00341D21CC
MATRISGKQTAARITAVVAVGSFAVAGLGFVVLEHAPTSDAATTTTAGPSENDDSPQTSGTSENDDSSSSPSVTTAPKTSQKSNSSQSQQVKKTIVRQKANSTASPVSPGNGGSTSGKSSGS